MKVIKHILTGIEATVENSPRGTTRTPTPATILHESFYSTATRFLYLKIASQRVGILHLFMCAWHARWVSAHHATHAEVIGQLADVIFLLLP